MQRTVWKYCKPA